jgi:LPXTG-motif cell wall-anchored protein
MFSSIFISFAQNATAAKNLSIPKGIFDTFNTSKGTEFYNAYSLTFYQYAENVPDKVKADITIPDDLFQQLDISQVTDQDALKGVFADTFHKPNSFDVRKVTFELNNGTLDNPDNQVQYIHATDAYMLATKDSSNTIIPHKVLNKDAPTLGMHGFKPTYVNGTNGEGMQVADPGTALRAGAELVGWYKDAALTEPFDFATDKVYDINTSTEVNNVTLYAKYAYQFTAATIDNNGGMPAETNPCQAIELDFYTQIDALTCNAPTKQGYEFGGFEIQEAGPLSLPSAEINAEQPLLFDATGTPTPNLDGYTDSSPRWINNEISVTLSAVWKLSPPPIPSPPSVTPTTPTVPTTSNPAHEASASPNHVDNVSAPTNSDVLPAVISARETLPNTGVNVLAFVVIAMLLMLLGVGVRMLGRKKR